MYNVVTCGICVYNIPSILLRVHKVSNHTHSLALMH